jgi:ribosome-associated protein
MRPGNAFDCGPRAWIDPAGLDFSFSRSGGPGGQNVNKVHSRAELMVKLTAIHGLDERALGRLCDAAGSHLVHGDTLRFTAARLGRTPPGIEEARGREEAPAPLGRRVNQRRWDGA